MECFRIRIPTSIQKKIPLKVHATIQLLFFYELHPDLPRPRIICSSRSACYLCNIFFHLHGGFHVPRTHGRLYDKWILPDWLEVPEERRRDLGVLSTMLKITLDKKVQMALQSKKRQFHYPNGSVLLPSAHWTSSALSWNLISSPPASTSSISATIPLYAREEPRL